ncbi:unnamed protein product [Citrullus colocynthis]|uniref:Uncharacterized protein n=1 Tax=Citrullus colocynthis TaxID=252529 RepID=A0ABP0YFN8_9ROSI
MFISYSRRVADPVLNPPYPLVSSLVVSASHSHSISGLLSVAVDHEFPSRSVLTSSSHPNVEGFAESQQVAPSSGATMNSIPTLEVLEVNPLAMILWVDNRVSDTSIDQYVVRIDPVSSDVHSTCLASTSIGTTVEISDTTHNVPTAALANVMFNLLTDSLVVTYDVFYENDEVSRVRASEAVDILGLSILGSESLAVYLPSVTLDDVHANIPNSLRRSDVGSVWLLVCVTLVFGYGFVDLAFSFSICSIRTKIRHIDLLNDFNFQI